MLKKLALLVASAVTSFVVLEAGLRLSGRVPSRLLHSVTAEEYARIPGFWEPGQDFISRQNPHLPYHVHIDALGLRGPETTRVPRRLRVLCIGDSFTFGDFVDDEETLPAQLGARIPDVEVLNAGVGGTTIVDQRVFLERLVALRPALVLLVFYENDLADLLTEPPLHVRFAEHRAWKSGWRSIAYRSVRDTALFNAVLKFDAALRARDTAVAAAVSSQVGTGQFTDALVARYLAAVVELRDWLGNHGIALAFAAFPAYTTFAGQQPIDEVGAVARGVAALGIDTVDLTGPLRGSGLATSDLYLLPYDGHARPRGYAIAADALVPVVSRAIARPPHGDP